MKLLPFNDKNQYQFKLQTIELLLLHTTAEEFIDKINALINSNTKFKFSIGPILDEYTAKNLSEQDLNTIYQAYYSILNSEYNPNIGDYNYEITIT